MKKEQLVFLVVGLAFGFLVGIGVYHVRFAAPRLDGAGGSAAAAAVARPQGPMAPTQVGAGADGDAPMVAEINRLKRVLENEPNNLPVLVRLGNLHYDVQMWPQAAGYYERAQELDPDDPDLLTDLGVCYRGMQQFERALELFARANQTKPDHWQSLFNTAIVAGFDLGQFDRADEALSAVERLMPQAPQVQQLRQALDDRRTAGASGGSS